MDKVPPAVRSRIMSRIRGRDTQPELQVRRYLHATGLRYRLHIQNLPGRPDLVFPSRQVCVFVHGCFWHGCRKCADGRRRAQSNVAYWIPKIQRNRRRDRQNERRLRREGWNVYTIWECETSDPIKLKKLRKAILSNRKTVRERA